MATLGERSMGAAAHWAVARRRVIGYQFAAASEPETILTARGGQLLALVYVVANLGGGNNVDVLLFDSEGNGALREVEVTRDRSGPLLQSGVGLTIGGDLVAQVADVAVTVSAWALEVPALPVEG